MGVKSGCVRGRSNKEGFYGMVEVNGREVDCGGVSTVDADVWLWC